MTEEKMRDYGFGVPLWSPYYHSETTDKEAASRAEAGAKLPDGDDFWWQQEGPKASGGGNILLATSSSA